MSVAAGSMFKWLDLLEKEFDRSFVQLDLLLGDIDPDQEELTNDGQFSPVILALLFFVIFGVIYREF